MQARTPCATRPTSAHRASPPCPALPGLAPGAALAPRCGRVNCASCRRPRCAASLLRRLGMMQCQMTPRFTTSFCGPALAWGPLCSTPASRWSTWRSRTTRSSSRRRAAPRDQVTLPKPMPSAPAPAQDPRASAETRHCPLSRAGEGRLKLRRAGGASTFILRPRRRVSGRVLGFGDTALLAVLLCPRPGRLKESYGFAASVQFVRRNLMH